MTATDPPEQATTGAKPLPPGPVPRGVSVSALYGGILALALIVVGLLAVYEAVLAWGLVQGTRPTAWLTDVLGVVRPAQQTFWISVALVVVGVVVFATALRRRPVRAYPLQAATGVYLRHSDAARLLERDLRVLPGVVDVRVRTKARRIVVQVRSTGAPETSGQVRETVDRRLACLVSAPTVKVELATDRTRGEVAP